MIKQYILILSLSVIMIGALIYGIIQSGSPFETRNKKFDAQRISAISNLTYGIDNYYEKEKKLPEKLSELKGRNDQDIKDPQSNTEYEYKVTGPLKYQICATFLTEKIKKESFDDEPVEDEYDYSYGSSYSPNKFDHPKGYHCFDFDVIPRKDYEDAEEDIPQSRLNVNENELSKRNRDATRLSDGANIQTAINVAVQEATSSGAAVLCDGNAGKKFPCGGLSNLNSRLSNGTGWVKVNLAQQKAISVPTLPIDPINDGIYHYAYCANNDSWEMNLVLEYTQQVSKMVNDGGDDTNKYELGSNLTLMDKNNQCKY